MTMTEYFITVTCPTCHHIENNVLCDGGFSDWTCPDCDTVVDLAEYTGTILALMMGFAEGVWDED
jgi:ribosomal protein S27E